MTNNFIGVRQLAEHFGCSVSTVRRWLSDGSLKSTRIGGGIRFSSENIAQFISNSEAAGDRRHDTKLPTGSAGQVWIDEAKIIKVTE